MRSPEQIPIQSDWCPSKEKGLVHRHRQKVVQHSEDASSTRQGQGLRRNQPGRHPGLRLPASNCERISRCCLSCSCVVPCLAGLGTNARAVACASSSAFFSPCGKHVWTAKSPTRQGTLRESLHPTCCSLWRTERTPWSPLGLWSPFGAEIHTFSNILCCSL